MSFHRRLGRKAKILFRSLTHGSLRAGVWPPQSRDACFADGTEDDSDWVDVRELVKGLTVEELAERADGYFRAVEDVDGLLAKPFKDARETPELLVTFGQVLRGLRLIPGMTVLDFGAGTCWTSRFMSQLGCRVKALDVSETALELGRRLYEELPVIGDLAPEPEFLVYGGHGFDLPDASVDRLLSFDAFHHVPNPREVIHEMARVLRPGGIAAFSEPGPRHSVQPQSQYEMRNYGILENDVVMEDVWAWARECGFAELRLCLLDSDPPWVDISTFNDVVAGREPRDVFSVPTRAAIGNRRLFWLRREGAEVRDSREAEGLIGELTAEDIAISDSGSNTFVVGSFRVHNPGPRVWLPSDATFGPVLLGVRLHLGDHTTRDFARVALPGRGVQPGQGVTVPVRIEIVPQPEGVEAVEFDLVSEKVCWLSSNGSPVVKVAIG